MVSFYQFWLELFSDGVSLVAVLISFYYVFKLVRLGRGVELLAIKGGHGPKYIALAILFLAVNRLMDLIAEPLIPDLTTDVAFALDDPPAALSAIFLAVGLRSMYMLYIRAAKPSAEIYSAPNSFKDAR
ncbi:MAG: hypothetical protein ACE5KU_06910 [Nitrososphaerales archaeon]